MDTKELQPVIDLVVNMEERLSRKLDKKVDSEALRLVHDDVKDTRDGVKSINGRLRKAEGDIIELRGQANKREATCASKLDNLTPNIKVVGYINAIGKSPKCFLFGVLSLILGLQIIVMEALEHNWLGELLKFIKP